MEYTANTGFIPALARPAANVTACSSAIPTSKNLDGYFFAMDGYNAATHTGDVMFFLEDNYEIVTASASNVREYTVSKLVADNEYNDYILVRMPV